jgi:rhodanese-related sulfurtransferase
MCEITVGTLKIWRAEQREHQLIDIREIQEFELGNLGGQHIPMNDCLKRHVEIRRDVPVVIHCRTGRRSAAVISALTSHHGFDNLLSLVGGAMEWASAVDPSIDME